MTFLPYNPTQLTEVRCKSIKSKVYRVLKVGCKCISLYNFTDFKDFRLASYLSKVRGLGFCVFARRYLRNSY